jgi:pSer/pThr/pTyr-binding forkhead associated (FHA) protein
VLTSGGSARLGSPEAAGYEREFPLTGGPGATVLIGRTPEADIRLADTGVSRRHGMVRRDSEHWFYEDLGSTNGSAINGRRVGKSELRDGDRLELGNTVLVFREPSHPRGTSGRSGGELSGHPAEA